MITTHICVLQITFHNKQVTCSHTAIIFNMESFDPDNSDFSEKLRGKLDAKDFALTLRKLMSGVAEDLPKPPTIAIENDLEMSGNEGNEDNQKPKRNKKKGNRNNLARSSTQGKDRKNKAPKQTQKSDVTKQMSDLHSPPKKNPRSGDEEIYSHLLGKDQIT